MCVSLWIGKGKYAQAQLQQQSVKSEDIIRSKRGKKKSSCSVSGVNFTGHFQSSLRSESPGESLSVRGRGGITGPTLHRIHHAPPYIKHFFFADWLHNQIPSEWAGVGWVRGEQKVGPLPLDNAIISAPLARNAKFHSRGAHWVRLRHRVIRSNHWSPRNQITHAQSAHPHSNWDLRATFRNHFVFSLVPSNYTDHKVCLECTIRGV